MASTSAISVLQTALDAPASERPIRQYWSGFTLRLLTRWAPRLALRRAERLLLTPERRPLDGEQESWLEAAHRETLESGTSRLPVWVWGGASFRPPTVLLVHDWGGMGAELGAFVAPLRREGARVVAFDQPAHGAAEGERTDLLQMAAIVHRMLDRFSEWAPPVGIVAHGYGALATMLALAGGVHVDRLVFLGAAENLDPFVERFRRALELSTDFSERVRRRYERRLGVVCEALTGHATAPRFGSQWLLAFHDADDREVPAAHSEALFGAWPGARLVRTHGLGHRGLLRHEPVIRSAVDHLLGAGKGR